MIIGRLVFFGEIDDRGVLDFFLVDAAMFLTAVTHVTRVFSGADDAQCEDDEETQICWSSAGTFHWRKMVNISFPKKMLGKANAMITILKILKILKFFWFMKLVIPLAMG